MNPTLQIALKSFLFIAFSFSWSTAAPTNEEGLLALSYVDTHLPELPKAVDPLAVFGTEGSGASFKESVKSTPEGDINEQVYEPGFSFIRIPDGKAANEKPAPTAISSRSTRQKIQFRTIGTDYDDYDYEETTPETTPRAVSLQPPKACDYNRCRHMQVPCDELRKKKSCLCPGITGPNIRPDPPRLQMVTVAGQSASINWCAPSSTVDKYLIIYRKQSSDTENTTPLLNNTDRIYTLSGLDSASDYVVCVVASNKAGSSATDDDLRENGPCQVFKTPSHYLLYLYVALPLAVLVLLVISILTCYFCAKRKKAPKPSSIATISDAEGVCNPSFNNE